MSGCAAPGGGRETLNTGYQALQQKRYDEAMAKADAYLQQTPQGPGAAEAMYLRGRVMEDRPKSDPPAAARDLNEAKSIYHRALGLAPSPPLEALIEAGIGNIAYSREDYKTGIEHFGKAYPNLEKPQDQAWALYRIGLCQQRLGYFTEADRTFAAVQKRYPETEQSRRAGDHQGARQFFLQIGVFSNAANAEKALAGLRKNGVAAVRLVDSGGRHLVRVGPVQTYPQARELKTKLAGQYPDAMIVP